jgi:DNA invertase Pin-like site-specific DNA recombinase
MVHHDCRLGDVQRQSPDVLVEDTPTAVLVRQVLAAVAQFEKATTVAKLAAARKRIATGKCEGRKSHAEVRPEAVRWRSCWRARGPTRAAR